MLGFLESSKDEETDFAAGPSFRGLGKQVSYQKKHSFGVVKAPDING
jgi:hypothetical protein